MNSIFENNFLDQPQNTEFLWRFIKPQYIDSLLRGEIYFAQLLEFNDYLENISPIHYLIHSMGNRLKETDLINFAKSKNRIERYIASMEFKYFENSAKHIFGLTDSENVVEKLIFEINNSHILEEKHFESQANNYSSCWFIGDRNESALMWNSYSMDNGIAIKIRFDKYKSVIENYLKLPSNVGFNNAITAGKVKYIDFYDYQKWVSIINTGVPLSYFKHKSFNQENEYRLNFAINSIDNSKFLQIHKVFEPLFYNNSIEFVMHPSANVADLEKFKQKLALPIGQSVSFSKLVFRKCK